METLSAKLFKKSKRPAMNYLALGNDTYFIRDGALHCRSNGDTFVIDDDGLDDDSIEYYAHLYYYLDKIEQLTQEYTATVFTK